MKFFANIALAVAAFTVAANLALAQDILPPEESYRAAKQECSPFIGDHFPNQVAVPASAQDLFIYPSLGQSQEQVSKDCYECHAWAIQITGYDPSNPQTAAVQSAPPPPSEPAQGGILRGAARGGAVAAAGGAIGGDASKGAAIGAATGALLGWMRWRDQQRRQQHQQSQYQQQQASAGAALDHQRNAYNRAMTVCLHARGYSVS